MRMSAIMPVSVVVIPTTQPLSSLGGLLGPLGTLALGAVLVALAVLVVGLLNERREARQRESVREEATRALPHPIADRSVQHAA